jgi:hypothetical protein
MTFDRQGLIEAARYAFGPNSLHFCGPERQYDILGYVRSQEADTGLMELLNRFETLYPYLVLIASENHLKDPFDRRVVEAYWLGNALLRRVTGKALVTHVSDTLGVKKKIPTKRFTPMMDVVVHGMPQHNFHVMNIFIRTGHHSAPHTISTMDNCRISWGRVSGMIHDKPACRQGRCQMTNTKLENKQYFIETQSLIYQDGRLKLGLPEKKVVTTMAVTPKIGDWVSIHWGYICAVLSLGQLTYLKKYTALALTTANRTI